MVTQANVTIKEAIDSAERMLIEARSAAIAPFSLELDGHLKISETPEGNLIIQVIRMPGADEEVEDSDPEPGKVIVMRQRRKRGGSKKILNSSNLPGFKGFVLKNGTETRRAAVVMRAYGVDPEGVPGREIIPWAKDKPEHSKEVMVKYEDQTLPLNDFVAQLFA